MRQMCMIHIGKRDLFLCTVNRPFWLVGSNKAHAVLTGGEQYLRAKFPGCFLSIFLWCLILCLCRSQRYHGGAAFWQRSFCNCSCDWSLKGNLSKPSENC